MKTYYLASFTNADHSARTAMQTVVRQVTADGFDRQTGLRIDRWVMVRAETMAQARERFARGEGIKHS